jgi:photosystem II stability/assembly factor-like uncharacterized protein
MNKVKYLILIISTLILYINFSNSQGWVQLNSGTAINLNCIYFTDANTGYIGADAGMILKTTNGGLNWILLNTNTNRTIYSIKFINNNTGFAATHNKILKTTNSGTSWDTTINGGGLSISFVNSNTGYSLKQLYQNSIWKTTNTGSSWDSTSIIFTTNVVRKIFFLNEQTGYAGGTFWTMSGGGLYQAMIWKTENSGITWSNPYSSINSGTYSAITDIYFPNAVTGFSLGYHGSSPSIPYIYKTVNSGQNWTTIQLAERMTSIKFADVNSGWVCGLNGKIMHSTNGGSGWSEQISGTASTLNEVFMVNSAIGYIAGQNGVILKTTNGGITSLQQTGITVPDNFSLCQNYPNPFNPATQIKFDIPISLFVNLIIYDVNGKEVSVLVNEDISAGSYSVDWNAAAYPSGVYFYRITAGEFIETKKMVLLK